MKRPTTGRRHIRSGSIHVTELVRTRPAPLDVPAEYREEAAAAVAAALSRGILGRDNSDTDATDTTLTPIVTHHRKPPRRGAQLAKLAGIGVAACVLCGSVAVASVITHHRQNIVDEGARPNLTITGERALLPDSLVLVAQDEAGVVRPHVPAPVTDTASGTFHGPESDTPATSSSRVARSTEPTTSANSAHPADATPTELAGDFYRRLDEAPEQALELLSDDLVGGDPTQFIRSWGLVDDITVLQLAERDAESVIATVNMRLTDGSHLRVTQLLHIIDEHGQSRIIGAEILSAQRS